MIFILILAFSAFFIALLGTKWVIFTIRKRAVPPDIDLLMGRRKASPLAEAGIALAFSLIIGLLGADTEYAVVLPLFLLAGIALLEKLVPIPKIVKLLVWGMVVAIALSVFSLNFMEKLVAGIFWLSVMYGFSQLKNSEGILPAHIISIGLGLSVLTVLAENFPSTLTTQSLIFASAGFGFLWWNWYPAKVFAGAIGAVPAGFIAGYLLLLAASNGYLAPALILPAYLLVHAINYKNTIAYKISGLLNFPSLWHLRLISGINMLLVLLAALAFLNPEIKWLNVTVAYVMVFGIELFFSRKKN